MTDASSLRYIVIVTSLTLLITIVLLIAVSILVGKINQMLIAIQELIKTTAASNENLLKVFNLKKERSTMMEMDIKGGMKMTIHDNGETSVNPEMEKHIQDGYIQSDDKTSMPKMTVEG